MREVALLPVQFSRGVTLEKIPSRVAPLYPNRHPQLCA
jgi:hypothetical protein